MTLPTTAIAARGGPAREDAAQPRPVDFCARRDRQPRADLGHGHASAGADVRGSGKDRRPRCSTGLLPRHRRGPAICRGSPMPTSSISRMSTIKCMAGTTKIARVLRHIRAEHEREKIGAAIFIGDAVEEQPGELYDAAADLGVPLFMFQEGDGEVDLSEPARRTRRAADSRAGLSRDRAADRWRLRQIRCRRRKAARRIAARGRRVCGRRNHCARRSEHRQRAQTARSNEVTAMPATTQDPRTLPSGDGSENHHHQSRRQSGHKLFLDRAACTSAKRGTQSLRTGHFVAVGDGLLGIESSQTWRHDSSETALAGCRQPRVKQ